MHKRHKLHLRQKEERYCFLIRECSKNFQQTKKGCVLHIMPLAGLKHLTIVCPRFPHQWVGGVGCWLVKPRPMCGLSVEYAQLCTRDSGCMLTTYMLKYITLLASGHELRLRFWNEILTFRASVLCLTKRKSCHPRSKPRRPSLYNVAISTTLSSLIVANFLALRNKSYFSDIFKRRTPSE